MMCKFTNAAGEYRGNPLYVNSEWIVSIYEQPTDENGSLNTVIYGGPTAITWIVEESLGEVAKIINRSNSVSLT